MHRKRRGSPACWLILVLAGCGGTSAPSRAVAHAPVAADRPVAVALASPFDAEHPAGCSFEVAPSFGSPLRLRLAPDERPFADVTAAPGTLAFPPERSAITAAFAEVDAPAFALHGFVDVADYPVRYPRRRLVIGGVFLPRAYTDLRYLGPEGDGLRVELALPPNVRPRRTPLVERVRCEDVGLSPDEGSFTLDEDATDASASWGTVHGGAALSTGPGVDPVADFESAAPTVVRVVERRGGWTRILSSMSSQCGGHPECPLVHGWVPSASVTPLPRAPGGSHRTRSPAMPVSPRGYVGRAACADDVPIVAAVRGLVRRVGVARAGRPLVVDLRAEGALVPLDLVDVQHGDPARMPLSSSCCGPDPHVTDPTAAPTLFVPRQALAACTLSTVPDE